MISKSFMRKKARILNEFEILAKGESRYILMDFSKQLESITEIFSVPIHSLLLSFH
jgi:hypothetical protein